MDTGVQVIGIRDRSKEAPWQPMADEFTTCERSVSSYGFATGLSQSVTACWSYAW